MRTFYFHRVREEGKTALREAPSSCEQGWGEKREEKKIASSVSLRQNRRAPRRDRYRARSLREKKEGGEKESSSILLCKSLTRRRGSPEKPGVRAPRRLRCGTKEKKRGGKTLSPPPSSPAKKKREEKGERKRITLPPSGLEEEKEGKEERSHLHLHRFTRRGREGTRRKRRRTPILETKEGKRKGLFLSHSMACAWEGEPGSDLSSAAV